MNEVPFLKWTLFIFLVFQLNAEGSGLCHKKLKASVAALAKKYPAFMESRLREDFFIPDDNDLTNAARLLIPDSYAEGDEKLNALVDILMSHPMRKDVENFRNSYLRICGDSLCRADEATLAIRKKVLEELRNKIADILSKESKDVVVTMDLIHQAISQANYGVYGLSAQEFMIFKKILSKKGEGYKEYVAIEMNFTNHAADLVKVFESLSSEDQQLFIRFIENNSTPYKEDGSISEYVSSSIEVQKREEHSESLKAQSRNPEVLSDEALVDAIFAKISDEGAISKDELKSTVSRLVRDKTLIFYPNQTSRLAVVQMSNWLILSFGSEAVSFGDLHAMTVFAEKLKNRFRDPPLLTSAVMEFRLKSLIELMGETNVSLELVDSLLMRSFESDRFTAYTPQILNELQVIAKMRFKLFKVSLVENLRAHLEMVNKTVGSFVSDNPSLRRAFIVREANAFMEKKSYNLVNQGGYVYSLNFDCWHGAVDAAIGLELNSLKVEVIEEALN